MLNLSTSIQVYLCSQPADMRRSFDGLSVLVGQYVKQADLYGGHLFVFRNRRGDRLKVLYWDGDGLAIWYKRLEQGVFQLPSSPDDHVAVTSAQLAMILEGIDIRNLPRRRGWGRKRA
jgi:transposase